MTGIDSTKQHKITLKKSREAEGTIQLVIRGGGACPICTKWLRSSILRECQVSADFCFYWCDWQLTQLTTLYRVTLDWGKCASRKTKHINSYHPSHRKAGPQSGKSPVSCCTTQKQTTATTARREPTGILSMPSGRCFFRFFAVKAFRMHWCITLKVEAVGNVSVCIWRCVVKC